MLGITLLCRIFNLCECSPREFQFRLVGSQLVQAGQFHVNSRDSNACWQTVLLCDSKFRSHTLCAKLTQRFQNLWFTKVKRDSEILLSLFIVIVANEFISSLQQSTSF